MCIRDRVGCDQNGVNAFFCQSNLLTKFRIKDIVDLYMSPKYGEIIDDNHIGHPKSNREMIEI